jgi:hypothetical protein
MECEKHHFSISELDISIEFRDNSINNMQLLPSFASFQTGDDSSSLFFRLTVDDQLKPRKDKELIRSFDTGNGDTVVYQLSDGGYQYIIKDVLNRNCCLLITNQDFTECQCALNGDYNMRSFGLNDALMLIFAFAGSFHNTLLIHASCVRNNGWAYPFTAKSGTGKSTHSNLWLSHIPNTDLVNDDNPIIRIIDGKPFIYGSPWSGKTPCYRNIRVPLGAVTQIERAPQNSIERLPPISAFAYLLPACSSMKWDSIIYNHICDIITRIIEATPIYVLHCLPDEEAAHLCYKTIKR